MSITVDRAVRAIRNELGADLSGGLTGLEIAEQAFAHLLALKEGWIWAQKIGSLDTVAGSKLVDLPADFGSLLPFSMQDRRMRILPDAQWSVMNAEHQSLYPHCPFARILDDENQLEFLDAFTKTEEGKFFIAYELRSVELEDESQSLPLPRYMHVLYLQLVRDLARGWDESDDNDVASLLDRTRRSTIYDAALNADIRRKPRGIQQEGMSRMRNVQVFPFNPIATITAPDGTVIEPNTL